MRIADNLGIAIGTDSAGSKVIVAEQTGRFDTIGIDCVAMNVNDVICIGAEPIALVDYLAVEQSDPEMLRQIAVGVGGSFLSTLGSTWLIRQVERDRSLLPYAIYRIALAATVVSRLRRRTR